MLRKSQKEVRNMKTGYINPDRISIKYKYANKKQDKLRGKDKFSFRTSLIFDTSRFVLDP
jgi:hypothetical protein